MCNAKWDSKHPKSHLLRSYTSDEVMKFLGERTRATSRIFFIGVVDNYFPDVDNFFDDMSFDATTNAASNTLYVFLCLRLEIMFELLLLAISFDMLCLS
jgi:hypothetical protein